MYTGTSSGTEWVVGALIVSLLLALWLMFYVQMTGVGSELIAGQDDVLVNVLSEAGNVARGREF